MTKRERKYHWLKKYINSPLYKFNRGVYENMWEWGIAGTKVWLDENDKVQLRILTHDECLQMEHNPPDGVTVVKEEI